MKQNTQQLFNQISGGDKEAFNLLFRGQYAKLVGFARTLIHESSLAEEVVSDLFVSLWMQREKLTTIRNADTYLYVSVKNRCLNVLRNKKYTVAIDELSKTNTQTYENTHCEMEYSELHNRLNQIIDQLPEQQKLVFRLIRENDMTAKQVADILQISHRTVETHLYKALKRLEKEITEYLGYSPKKKK